MVMAIGLCPWVLTAQVGIVSGSSKRMIPCSDLE